MRITNEIRGTVALECEWNIFLKELPRLIAEGKGGKYVLIHADAVEGVWDTLDEALVAGYDRFALEPFLAQEINDNPEPRTSPATRYDANHNRRTC